MGRKSGKKHPLLIIFITLFWFFILLPSIKLFFTNTASSQNEFTLFAETENELADIIYEESANFPDEFISLTSNWESYSTNWTTNWHIYKPYLDTSILELENLDASEIYYPKGKKSKNREISPEEFWAQVYNIIITNNEDRVKNLAYAFRWFQDKNKLSDSAILNIIIDFIQQIPYEIPENNYGLYTPTEVLFRNAGDCDSKSVLAALLLKELGYDTALYYSKEYKHVMLGINTLSTGEYKELNGKPYYFTEMTSPGWQIGDISPDCADLKYWNIVSIKQPEETKTVINPEILAIPMTSIPEDIIRHTGFSLLYSEEYEQAAWVAYVLSQEELNGTVSRSNNFREDPAINTGSAALADYKGSGYDRGHLAPAGDLKWSESAMKDSFYLSNMSPQEPGFNRGIWKNLEEWTREQASLNSGLIIITGPVLTDGPYEEIGKNSVVIPKRYFKVLLDYTEPEIKAIGFIMENKTSKKDILNFAVSIDEVENITGLDFFFMLPDGYEEKIESQFDTGLWL